jgi:hypothetical protein
MTSTTVRIQAPGTHRAGGALFADGFRRRQASALLAS